MNYFILFQILFLSQIFSMEEKPVTKMQILSIKNSNNSSDIYPFTFHMFLNIYKTNFPAHINNTYYKMSFYGIHDNYEKIYENKKGEDSHRENKQNLLLEKIKNTIHNTEQFKKIIQNAQIVYPELLYKKTEVEKMYKLKVPIYTQGAITKNRYPILHQLIWNESMSEKENGIYEEDTIPAFTSGLFPWYYYDTKNQELHEKSGNELLGIIFANGVNFEETNTADYKRFLDKKGNLVHDKKEELGKYIQEITDTIIYSGLKLTENATKDICYLRIPKIGLGAFLTKLNNKNDKIIMIKYYLKSFQNSLIKYYAEFSKKIYIDFFNYGNDKNYNTEYYDIFNQDFIITYNNKIIPHCDEKGDIFNKELRNPALKNIKEDEMQTIIVHGGDAHAFLGNGGYYDETLEKCLLGFHNNDYLTPAHVLNIVLSKFFKDEEPEIKIIEIEGILEYIKELENKNKELKNIIKIITFFTLIGYGIILYHNKSYLNNNILTPIKYYFINQFQT